MRLKLPPQELRDFAVVVGQIITSIDVRELKTQKREDYLLFACVSDFVDRSIKKTTDFSRFETVKRLSDGSVRIPLIKVTVKRYEAIALFFILSSGSGYIIPGNPVTDITIREVLEQIHKTFMI